jgi:hypothetical protein
MGLSGGGVKDGWRPFSTVSFANARRLKEGPTASHASCSAPVIDIRLDPVFRHLNARLPWAVRIYMSFQTPKDCKKRNAIHPRRDPRTKSNDFQPHEQHTKTKQDQDHLHPRIRRSGNIA